MRQKDLTMAKVSIVTVTFNRKDYLRDAVKSVQAQTYKDWEMIVVDNGSTDGTPEYLKELSAADPRVRSVRLPPSGITAARAEGLRGVRGEYVAFLDDDDLYHPKKLELQVDFLEKNSRVALVYSQADMVDDAAGQLAVWPERPSLTFVELIRQNTILTNTVLLRHECLEKIAPPLADLESCDDYDLWLRIARQYPIAYFEEKVAVYRWHPLNISHNAKRRCASFVNIFKNLKKLSVTHEERRAIIESMLAATYWKGSDALDKRDYGDAAFYFRMAVKADPQIGNWVPWSKYSNRFFRILKPYFAIFYCSVRSLFARKVKVS